MSEYDIRPAKKKKETNKLLEALIVIVIGAMLALSINAFVVKMYQIPSASMNDTLEQGDYTMALPLFHKAEDLRRGDIVVFRIPVEWKPEYDGELFIKRVIGLGGDTVSSLGDGSPIQVNGVPIKEYYLQDGTNPSEVAFSYTVPAGEMFVLGDNRSNSLDSRYHLNQPFVKTSNVVNRPVARVLPVNRFTVFPDVSTTFRDVPDPAPAPAN